MQWTTTGSLAVRSEGRAVTTPTDASMVELIAGCEDLSEGYARALQALRQLTQAGLEGRGMSATVLHAYHEQAEAAAADLKRFLALVGQVKAMFTVH